MPRRHFASAAAAAAICVLVTGAAGRASAGLQPHHQQGLNQNFELRSTIAFTSTRDDPPGPALGEIYVMDADGTNPRRITVNAFGDAFPSLSPDGKKFVFDSNRLRAADEPFNTSDLFVMDADGSGQAFVTRGSSGSWSPDGKRVAFHASASGTGLPIKADPGAATEDSDIFVVNVDDAVAGLGGRINLTHDDSTIDVDPDWSPDGQTIAYTSHARTDNPINSVTAEIHAIAADGTGAPQRLTFNTEEERAPAWSPDGARIVFMCRRGGNDFEICVMNADGSNQVQLTSNLVADLTPTWSLDGQQIAFHRATPGGLQLFLMNADGTGQRQLTTPPGLNLFANWGVLRVHLHKQ